jgi:hypothetical protein
MMILRIIFGLKQLQLHMIPGTLTIMGLHLLLSVFVPEGIPVRMETVLCAQGVLLVSTKM